MTEKARVIAASNSVDVPLDELHPHPDNARQGVVPKIMESLAELGQYRSIVVNFGTHTEGKRVILAGHHLVLAARQLGWETVAVQYVDVDDQTARKILLADNSTSDAARNDPAALLALLESLSGDFQGTGYEQPDLDLLMIQLSDSGGGIDPSQEWDNSGLPPFESDDLQAAYVTHISFATEADADRFFSEVVDREKRRRWWWPESDGHRGMISNSEVSSGITDDDEQAAAAATEKYFSHPE